jgi:hypothetical protein
MAERKPAKKGTQKSGKSATGKAYRGFTEDKEGLGDQS